jgi:hypothetical protein
MLGHIFEDYRNFGNVMKFSAFKYENHLREVKKVVKNSTNPLVSVQKRQHNPQAATVVQPVIVAGPRNANSWALLSIKGGYAIAQIVSLDGIFLRCTMIKLSHCEPLLDTPRCRSLCKIFNVLKVRNNKRYLNRIYTVRKTSIHSKLVTFTDRDSLYAMEMSINV